jgi:hypothetical protein
MRRAMADNHAVIPAQAGTQFLTITRDLVVRKEWLDPGLRRDDDQERITNSGF